MKFFKHFTDAHRGGSLQILKQKHGWAGVGKYWVFVEICAEKLHKKEDEEFTENHCRFTFGKSALAKCLDYGNHAHLMRYLSDIHALGLCSIDADDVKIVCSMPKLLEYMDRDAKRARADRGPGAPKKKIKKKKKKEDKEIANQTDLIEAIGDEGLKTLLETFPQNLVDYELPFMTIWLKANGPKSNYLTFAVNWLRKAEKDLAENAKKQNMNQRNFGIIGAS